MEKQRHNEQMVSREKLRLREEAAPELRAAELLATEAERLEEELTDVHAQYATMQVELKKREDLLRGWGVGGDPSPVTAANCFWSQYDAAEGIPLVLADFLEQIHLPDPALSSSHVRPEEAPKLLIASLRRLQMAVMKRDEELKVASEKITELSKCRDGKAMQSPNDPNPLQSPSIPKASSLHYS
eukprot:g32008.t1